MPQFLDDNVLRAFDAREFTDRAPFPFFNFRHVLTPDGFDALYNGFPPLSLFDKHVGMERVGGQRPHNRYYLAYEHSIYGKKADDAAAPGEVKHGDLPAPWQAFMTELQTSDEYKKFIARLLGHDNLTARYAWHVGVNHSEVSPHRDADNKIGTHIFYFNTSDDWNMDWGGATLALSGKKIAALNPDFSDFDGEVGGEIRDNHSFLFKNTENAWHGVKTLACPDDKYRRLFNVIFHDAAEFEPKKSGGLMGKLRGVLSGGGR